MARIMAGQGVSRKWQQETREGERLTIETINAGLVIPYPDDPGAAAREWAGMPRPGWEENYLVAEVRPLWRQSLRQGRRMVKLTYRIVLYRRG